MNIAFFVSNHGYGHLMRELPVITELLRRGHRIVLVTAEKHILLAKDYLLKHTYSGELITIADEVDVGILVVPGSLTADWEAMKKKLPEYISTWPQNCSKNMALKRSMWTSFHGQFPPQRKPVFL